MLRRLLVLLIATGALCALPAVAHGQGADIEAVWTFGGGEVAIKAQSDGTFRGTIIRETRLDACPHPVGEQMWTELRRQPDGQYWGRHQYYNTSDCSLAARGQTAYRVLTNAEGGSYLRVCFSRPETPDVQPKIAADGSSTDDNDGCLNSALVRALPTTTPKVTTIATLPSQGSRRCLSRRSFTIKLKQPAGDALATATVSVNGRRVATREGDRITAPINLRGLPRGRYTVQLRATTVLGRTIIGTRKYRTCAPRRSGANRGPL